MITTVKFNIPNTENGIRLTLEQPATVMGEEITITIPDYIFDDFVKEYKEYREELNDIT